MAWSNEQKAFLVHAYTRTKSFKESLRLFCRHFKLDSRALPGKLPSKQNIMYWYHKFLSTGSVQSRNKGAQHTKWKQTEEVVEDIRQSVIAEPKKSLRRRSSDFPISHMTLSRAIKGLKGRPYALTTHQGISPQHQRDRVEMCKWFLARLEEDETFLQRVWFSDESHFYLNGYMNSKKVVYWGFQKPDEVIEKNRHVQKVTAWVAMSYQGIIGPFWFLDDNDQSVTVNSERYLHVLEEFWKSLGRKVGGAERQYQWFMQDGAAPHTAARVLTWLQEHFEERLIGRRLANSWAARSPDINPLDFYLWGRVKDQMIGKTFENLREVREGVETLVSQISAEECRRVVEHFVRRVKKCIDKKGRHIEHVL